MTTRIKGELKKRLDRNEDNYAVVGTELKNRRTALSRTLNYVAFKTCSVSYLSKLENNKIIPNQAYVKEISDKLDLTEDNIETLLKSKAIVIEAVKCFLEGNLKKMKGFYEDSLDLNNYRAMLIKLIFNLMTMDINEANKLYGSIMSLISSMTDVDLLIFSLFSGILHYLNYEFEEALDDLYILKECSCNGDMILLRDKYIFLASNALSSSDTPLSYQVYTDELIKCGRYNMLDEAHYLMALYYARSDGKEGFKRMTSLIATKRYRDSASFIKDFYSNQSAKKLCEYKDSGLNAFCQLIKSMLSNSADVKGFCKGLKSGIYEPDNDTLVLNYLALDEIDERISFITNVAFPRLMKTKEGHLIDYFFNELSYLGLNMGKYKLLSEWHIRFYSLNHR